MGLAKKKSEKLLAEQQIIKHPDFSGRPEQYDTHEEVYVASCVYTPMNEEIVVKIPLIKEEAQRLCMNEYDLKRTVGDHKHLHQLYGTAPLEFGSYFAVLSKKAPGNAKWQMEEGELNEDNSALYILHASLGLSEIHKKGKTHRDIKPSNILLYDEEKAVLADFGVVSEIGKHQSKSAKNEMSFWSPEVWVMKNSKDFNYDPQEDIYQVGATYFMMLTGGNGLEKALDNVPYSDKDTPQQIIQKHYPVIMNLIEQQNLKYDTKRRLRRFLGPRPPKKIPAGKSQEDYRYQSIDAAISDLQGKSGIIEIREHHPDIETFLSYIDEFKQAIQKVPKNRNGEWDTVNYETIDELVSIRRKVLELQESAVIQANPNLSRKAQPYHDRFCIEQKKDEDSLRKVILLLKDDPSGLVQYGTTAEDRAKNFWIPMFEISYLWGPPLTKSKSLSRKKDTYTLAEIDKENTHFHKEKPWA